MIGPVPNIGGKRRVAKKLAALLPPHQTYVELFAGGSQVLFAKTPSPVEVINDLDESVVGFLRVAQHHHEELSRYLRYMVASRRLFELYEKQDDETLTDIQRAAKFLYLQKNAFGGKRINRNFHVGVQRPVNYNPSRLPQILEAAAKRLERVQLEQRPYQEVLGQFDRPETAFFLDPPYVGIKRYKHTFEDDDFRDMADRLAHIRGKFLLTINDCPLSREVFGRFCVREFSLTYTANRNVRPATELLVSNYPTGDFAKV